MRRAGKGDRMPVEARGRRASPHPAYSVSLLQAAAALYGLNAVRDDALRPQPTSRTDKKFRE
ncbi:hypothetical protein E5554_05900 [Sphingobium sp. PAMC28499]|jgi:hypothetical protein|nr:hypothetical protein EBF16_23900 [Sphingobium yanoikuyae]PZU68575.1 MAG: hypothetical protein DI540_07410 [Sphingobium sp.]QCB37405.1 hypothetical protein E5554_05900 [Sphingobium sp. PAMC28499]RSU72430.1 hypothetical protein BRX37_19095 [Sphingomonas sp. S-NIH.Pt3_0716]NBB37952.1 hypothetical protein [Sphingobium yanoikuyae]